LGGRGVVPDERPFLDQARFVLDEAKAAEWLAAQIAETERYRGGETSEVPMLELDGGYSPRDDYEGYNTAELVWTAREAELITGPGEVYYDHSASEGECGYVWLVHLGGLKLSTFYEKLRHLGAGGDPGAPAALGVLREAVDAANGVLDDLDRYVQGGPRGENVPHGYPVPPQPSPPREPPVPLLPQSPNSRHPQQIRKVAAPETSSDLSAQNPRPGSPAITGRASQPTRPAGAGTAIDGADIEAGQ
jgi:hypothetical protein